MRPVVTINLSIKEKQLVQDIARFLHRPPNIALYSSIRFAEFCVFHPANDTLVLRNDRDQLQKNLYFGAGLTLVSPKAGWRSAKSRIDSTPAAVETRQIEGDIIGCVAKLVRIGFGNNRREVISRAIWATHEVVQLLSLKPQAWEFGWLDKNSGKFFKTRPDALADRRPISRDDAQIRGYEMWHKFLDPDAVFDVNDEQRARLYFQCANITASNRIKWLSAIVGQLQNQQFVETIHYLARTLSLTLDEAKKIAPGVDTILFHERRGQT